MLIESLIRYKMEKQAAHLFRAWYLDNRAEPEPGKVYATKLSINTDYDQLDDLIPIHTLLTLSGISHWTSNEITVENINQNLGPITVQYGQTVLDLSRDTCVIKHENGESSTITQAGKYKIFPE